MKLNIKNIFIYVMSYSISLYFVLLVLFYTADRNSWSRYVRHYLSFFPANIENNRHKWKFFEKEKVQYLLIGQKANYLLNKQSRAKIWYTHFHIWRNFRSTKHWICFHDFKVMFVVSFILYSINKLFVLEEKHYQISDPKGNPKTSIYYVRRQPSI